MTTVAYKDGFMAADSKMTDALGSHVTRMTKIFRLSAGGLLGVAGDADVRDVVALLDKCRSARSLPSREALARTKSAFAGILVFRNGDIFDIAIAHDEEIKEWTGGIVEIKDGLHAIGSGYQFAIGAMAAGASAYNAVVLACRFDTASGGPVRMVQLKETKQARPA
jgi:hypothetical protein